MRRDNLSGTKYPINNFDDDDDDVVFLRTQIIMLTVMMWILML